MASKKPALSDIDPNVEVFRVTIQREMLFNLQTGSTRSPLGARIEILGESTPTGRDKWIKVGGPIIAFTSEDGTAHDDPTAAELLECVGHWCRSKEADNG